MELVPKKYWSSSSCRRVQERFGIPPDLQILDDNYHHDVVASLPNSEKRGRPDIVHYALLDIVSTPAYLSERVRVFIHTINGHTISIGSHVRLPRTEIRFYGVMSKILSNRLEPQEHVFFQVKMDQSFEELVNEVNPSQTICLSREGILRNLRDFIGRLSITPSWTDTLWVVGGFPRGHFTEETKSQADQIISISSFPLAAHVVTARLCYEIEMLTIARGNSKL